MEEHSRGNSEGHPSCRKDNEPRWRGRTLNRGSDHLERRDGCEEPGQWLIVYYLGEEK